MFSSLLWSVVVVVVVTATLVTGEKTTTVKVDKDDSHDNSTVLSPAEELLQAAKEAGYELTLDRLDEAGAATDAEVEELMPPPVAEAFISYRRRDNMDVIREKMIGMIFTGNPRPLGPAPPRLPHQMGGPPLSRRHHTPPRHHHHNPPPRRPNHPPPSSTRHNPFSRFHTQFNPQEVPSPQEILKPLPFEPGPTMVKFPPHHPAPGPSPPRQNPGPPPIFTKPVEDFSNTVGPDFGPVTFTEFGGPNFGFQGNFENDFGEFSSEKLRPRPSRPSPGQRPSPGGARPPPVSSKRPPSPHRPPPRPASPRPAQHPPSHPPSRPPSRPPPRTPSRPRPSGFGNSGLLDDRDEGCVKYTDDICLDTEKYPHEAILTSLVHDPARARSMVAEVRSQSADELVDGVSAAQESKYDFQHYFGNRRTGTDNHVHRDFAQDGGFLCPSEVKYARPKRARNSKGDWKFVVNMDKYTQTIRMEKCLKAGGACSYVSHHYRATCNQVYNYHRLLSWEDGRGLHMDIFKVPACCSCHIQGYAYIFPPLSRHQNTAFSSLNPQFLPGPTDLEAPAFSPVNFPNVPSVNQRRLPAPRPPQRRPTPSKEIRRRTQEVERQGEAVNRRAEGSKRPQPGSDDEEDRVNYGYHPIIDFFNPYSSDARHR